MIYSARELTAALIIALLLSPSATAEEVKAAPAAAKPAAPASDAPPAAKPAAPKAEATTAVKPAAPKVEPPAAAKPAALLAAIDRKQAEIPAPQPVKPKSAKRRAPQRVAPAATSVRPEIPTTTPVAAPHALHWSYEGDTGPQAWAKLAPDFARCGSGERQSPIDIRDGMKLELEPITFEYRPSAFRVIDNGHAIQANIRGWNSLRVMGRRFSLVQMHFHSPSEEMIEGRQFDMVAHLVHKDNEGRLAVVAVLIESGARQPAIQTVLNNLPLEKGEEIAAAANLDLNQMLPEDRKYFTYMGSLTTPPCTEDVLWIVMKQPVQAAPDQLSLFARLYPMNARPIQSASGRVIKESN